MRRIRSVVCGSITHVWKIVACRTMMKRVVMLILVVDGVKMMIAVWKHVRLSTILKVIVTETMNVFGLTARMSVLRIVLRITTMRHPVTLRLDVDGMPQQEVVVSVSRIASLSTLMMRRVVTMISCADGPLRSTIVLAVYVLFIMHVRKVVM